MNAPHHTTSRLLFRQHLPHPFGRRRLGHRGQPNGFTITELLVVIGIIILLAGILLVALGRVRTTALQTTTLSTMQSFSQACDAFQTEHQQYPGVIPETILARAIANNEVSVETSGPVPGGDAPSFTSTENALLHLMGGYRVVPPSDTTGAAEQRYDQFVQAANSNSDPLLQFTFLTGRDQWKLAVNLQQIGEGPIINRQQYSPYFTPGANVIGNVTGQRAVEPGSDTPDISADVVRLPDLLDAWGQPILYFRQVRNSGPLTGPVGDGERPQFYLEGAWAYLNSTELGEFGQTQVFDSSPNPPFSRENGSILSSLGDISDVVRYNNFAQLLRHPSYGNWELGPLDGTNQREVRARGAYALFSAGPDGIFFSAMDGPGPDADGEPVRDLTAEDYNNPQSVEAYDDIRVFGGG